MISSASAVSFLSCSVIFCLVCWLKSVLVLSVLMSSISVFISFWFSSVFMLAKPWLVIRMMRIWRWSISSLFSWFCASSSHSARRTWILSWKFSNRASWMLSTLSSWVGRLHLRHSSSLLLLLRADSLETRFSLVLSSSISPRRSSMMFLYSAMCSSTSVLFSTALVLMFLARLAYLSVLRVSSNCVSLGEMVTIMMVLQLPPSESLSILVSFESL